MTRFLSLSTLGLLTLFLASFGDEVASFTFALQNISSVSMTKVSILLCCSLCGGFVSGPFCLSLLRHYQPRSLLGPIFAGSALTVLFCLVFPQNLIYLGAAFVLGCFGGVFGQSSQS